MLMKRGIIAVLIVLSSIMFFPLVSAHHCEIATNHLPLKVSIVADSFTIRNFSLTSEYGGLFSLESTVQGVQLTQEEDLFDKQETKQFSAYFNGSGLEPGVYTGWIGSTNRKERFHIPVIFEVESKGLFFDINLEIPPVYTEVNPGEKVIAQAKIFDLVSRNDSQKLGATSVDLSYMVYKIHGGEISSSSETIVVDKNTETTLSLDISEDIDCDEYVFVAKVTHGNSVGVASRFFVVSLPESFAERSLSDSDHSIFLIIVGILVIIIIALIVLFFAFMKHERSEKR